MGKTADNAHWRAIPPVDDILAAAELQSLRQAHPRLPWTQLVRGVIDEYRRLGAPENDRQVLRERLVDQVQARIRKLESGGMRRVINGTGVILHTNIGRAILGESTRRAIDIAAAHYVNLEIDLETGKRSQRGAGLIELIRLASGAEAAMVVNNNAAAVYLVTDTFSPPGRVLISRGELVEIGGSFRLPDILEKAAGEVIEVGTTNRTYTGDFAKHARRGDIILRAHPSNYAIEGFTHRPGLADLVSLASERGCYVVYDVGSGSFYDFDRAGVAGEELVGDAVASGVDCVTMSGDKLLGGVQAGIVVGRAAFLDALRSNPLRRALRIDKLTIAAMEALFRHYLLGRDPSANIPVLRQSTEDPSVIHERARAIVGALPASAGERYAVAVVEDTAAVGGGSFAGQDIPSAAISITCDSASAATALARRMRQQPIPLLSRIKSEEVRINLRSVMPYEDGDVTAVLSAVLAP